MPEGGALVGVLDTNVLMRAGLLEFLFEVHANGAYRARWSATILVELEKHLPGRAPHITRRIRTLLAVVPDAELPVTAGDGTPAVGACHPEDEHVLAAALCARRIEPDADVRLVTGNMKDFDIDAARRLGIEVVDPDAFGVLLLDRDPVPVLRAVQRQPGDRYHRFLERMRNDGLVNTADSIHQWFEEIGR